MPDDQRLRSEARRRPPAVVVRSSGAGSGQLAALVRRWFALVSGLALLHLAGRGTLRLPSLSALLGRPAPAPPGLAIETTMAVIRLLALGVGAYLLIVVTIALVGRVLDHRPALALATLISPPSLRALLALATTATVAVAGATGTAEGATTAPTLRLVGPTTAGPPATDQTAPILRWVAPASGRPQDGASQPTAPGPSASGPAPARPTTAPSATVPPAAAGPRTAGTGARAPAAGRTRPPVRRAPGPTVGHRDERPAAAGRGRQPGGRPVAYVVRPGDNFWTIASAQLRYADGVGPIDDERVARYWRLLIQTNRSRLPVPGQPDLLFPGDRIQLPPVS